MLAPVMTTALSVDGVLCLPASCRFNAPITYDFVCIFCCAFCTDVNFDMPLVSDVYQIKLDCTLYLVSRNTIAFLLTAWKQTLVLISKKL
jgi:hypothetical protein